MRKAQIVSSLFVLVFILIAGVVGANQANAVVCPAGLICIPKDSTLEGCPSGFVCMQNPAYTKPIVSSDIRNACYRFTKNLGEFGGAPGYESTGADVVALQIKLIDLGFDISSVTQGSSAKGQFEEDTKAAVMKYQASKGIPSTGFVGPLTRASLNASCNSNVLPVISLVEPQPIKVGSVLTVYVKNAGKNGNIILTTADGLKMWSTGYATDVKMLNGFSQYDGSRLNFVIPSTIGRGVHPDGWWNEPTMSITGGIYKLYVSALDVNNNFIKSNVVDVQIGTPSTTYSPSPTPTSGATTIKVLSPNGGESFVGGSSYNIKWYDDNDAGNKNIYLVSSNGQITTLASNVFVRSSGIDSTYSYSWKVTDSIGSDQYKIKICKSNSSVCDLSDNTFQVSTCPAGYKCSYSVASPSPTPTYTPAQPSVSFIYPTVAETWYQGQTKYVSWSYNNFSANVSGDRFVELQLIPQDGREPVVLGTYTSPYGYQPLTIYAKTSTGRDAWLPGTYKLRLVCRTTNVNGYRNCRDEVIGPITVKVPTPSPTTTPVTMDSSSQLNASIWSAIEEYNRGR